MLLYHVKRIIRLGQDGKEACRPHQRTKHSVDSLFSEEKITPVTILLALTHWEAW